MSPPCRTTAAVRPRSAASDNNNNLVGALTDRRSAVGAGEKKAAPKKKENGTLHRTQDPDRAEIQGGDLWPGQVDGAQAPQPRSTRTQCPPPPQRERIRRAAAREAEG